MTTLITIGQTAWAYIRTKLGTPGPPSLRMGPDCPCKNMPLPTYFSCVLFSRISCGK